MRVLSRLLLAVSLTLSLISIPLLTSGSAQALENHLALTPPMGWNSWNTFGCNATEQIVKETTDFMASSGMRDAGYQYLTIDDCWMERSRDSGGRLVPDARKYPHGLAELATYVHGKGLKFGVYESPTYHTCQGFPGSLGYEQQDANTFASWGVDFLKYDNCLASDPAQRVGDEKLPLETRDGTMRDALERTGRPIVFSLSLQPAAQGESPWEWGKSVANMWRIDGDRDASFDGLKRLIHTDLDKAKWAGPGGWNDLDMLGTGNYAYAAGSSDPTQRLTYDQEKSELSVAAVLAAPLISGADLRTAAAAGTAGFPISSQDLSVYLNKDVIAVNQDSRGEQGTAVSTTGGLNVLRRPLANGDMAVALFNETSSPSVISTTAAAAGLPANSTGYNLNDLWAHTSQVSTDGTISATVPAGGTVLYRVSPRPTSTGPANVLVSVASGRCLDAWNNQTSPGTKIEIWSCNGGANQRWAFTSNGDMRAYNGTQCLGAMNGVLSSGTSVVIQPCDASAGQKWQLNADNTITARSQLGLCLAVAGENTPQGNTDGTLVEVHSCNGGANQRWTTQ
ncbi:glycoside hydrolase family 27 protein [Streptomyces kronopolitis]|uniref:glycoside hydrolase family 27 protein n=1 Tax=Streptomyces kronopolitis TaxID=1612435 RepID=UPI0020BFDDEB|nr:ricin-type beta-trefoil lectin domain protein [Streptomyces kronopolitis]MCL6301364.1 ricin-type beta-trefoil lectin domain protein [Streptomyces kronopolitis]